MPLKRFHMKAALWVSTLPERRGDAIDAGCKGVLQAHWNHIDFEVERDTVGEECWPSAETIADQIGSTEAAVIDRRRKLVAAGWMRRDGRGWALAWMVPFGPESRSSATPVTATQVAPETGVSIECDSSNSDSSHRRPLPESSPTATRVIADRDPSPTNQIRIKSGSDAEEIGAQPAKEIASHPHQAEHESIVAKQAANAAEIQRARDARPAVTAALTPAPEADWLVVVAQPFAQFGQLAALNSEWRGKTEATTVSLGWSREHLAAMLAGYQLESDERRIAGSLAADIDANRFPQARYVFSTSTCKAGERREKWHGPDGLSWAQWAYKRWAAPKPVSTPKRRSVDSLDAAMAAPVIVNVSLTPI